MIREKAVEQEAEQIAHEIWKHLKSRKGMPRIQSKQGGSSAAYYPHEHMIRVRNGSWRKLNLAGKRLLMIHELWHSSGHEHSGLYLHSFDIVSLVVYERIYGKDQELEKMYEQVKAVVDEALK